MGSKLLRRRLYAIAVAVTDDGTVFAVAFGNNRIQKWRPAGRAGR